MNGAVRGETRIVRIERAVGEVDELVRRPRRLYGLAVGVGARHLRVASPPRALPRGTPRIACWLSWPP